MKFPKHFKRRGRLLATIYGKSRSYAHYRLCYYDATRKRHMRHYRTYSEALSEAEKLVKDLAKGSPAPALTRSEANDALIALGCLGDFYRITGRRIKLADAVGQFCDAASKLQGRSLGEAVDGFLCTAATVKRKDLSQATEEFLALDQGRTRSSNGQRPQLCAKYAYQKALLLRRFAETFKNMAILDLGKQHLDLFIGALDELSPKTRSHYRTAIGGFLRWCVRRDYLAPTHRLLEADSMRSEVANTAEVQFYSPGEFRKLVEAADECLRPLVAIGGLAGLRVAELLRLSWKDVWAVPGHVQVTASKSKTRQRRLVEVVPALSLWLEEFRSFKDGKLTELNDDGFQRRFTDLCERAGVSRKRNGLRHSYCSFHFALHANENLTAQQAGNSPAMIHAHYKGLATKSEAEKWFTVMPAKADNIVLLAGGKEAV
jgi:integrase